MDHGKTALVKALTGVDADTLAEEKRRGITIELGFVFMDVPPGTPQVVFIDVPGHEKLVRTMVAGASSLQGAMLVIAADEGVQPQTQEHADILRLLGVTQGVVALTKCDLVDAARLAQVTAEVHRFVARTSLATAPIVPVSAVSGDGVEDLRRALCELAATLPPRSGSGAFRMPVDRVFTLHGFGTVIAGTVLAGVVRPGDRVTVYPDQLEGRVRTVQVHGQTVGASGVGQRTALNIPDIPKESLRRGQCAAAPGSLTPTTRLDVRLLLLPGHLPELKHRDRLRVHVGTEEVIASVVLLDRDRLSGGDEAPAQLLLESPTVAVNGDRFVVRTLSPVMTVGGGVILRSLGSAGGLDILAVYTNKRWGLRPGIVIMASNALVLLAGALYFNIELALHSLIFVYTSSRVIDVILTGFNRRKALLIVSKESHKIADDILFRINRGVTYLKGKGGYTGEDSDVIFTVTTLTELPRMKDIVYGIDPEAFMVVNDTLEVLGKRHGTRRVY